MDVNCKDKEIYKWKFDIKKSLQLTETMNVLTIISCFVPFLLLQQHINP